MMLPDHIQNACDWANMRGWRVFPANPLNKAPLVKDPFGRATSDRDAIIELFSTFPNSTCGVPCGPINNITVIDIDRKNGVDGWAELMALGIEVPTTGVVSTPSNGFHLYFDTGNLEIPNSVSSIAPGIDVRGAGGYVIGPSSVTPKGKYIWGLKYISPLGELAKLPAPLLRLVTGIKSENHYPMRGKSNVQKELLDPIPEGQRNTKMASRIGYLLKKIDHKSAWEAAEHINNTCCKPPLELREVERTFRSILKREMRHGR